MIGEGNVLSERYRLLSLEGEGGMAFVYKARDLELDRIVAIKVLRSGYDASDAFRREARAAAQVPHPNIVTIYDVGQDGQIDYIVMEHVDGQTLKDLILTGAPFRVGRTVDILTQVCEAVGLAHKNGIVHCDLKPQNVLVLPNGQVKVTDFGIARAFSGMSAESRGKVWGTPYYAAPEVVSGRAPTPASDVYAVGVMLYEMLAGRLPFAGQNAAEVARQHVLNAPAPIRRHSPRVPRYLEKILDRTLSKDPQKRYQTAGQLARLLASYREHGNAITQPLQPLIAVDTPAGAPPRSTRGASLSHAEAEPRPKAGFDWLMLLLAGFAFVAVMGLLPLWGTVIARTLGPLRPVPTATVDRDVVRVTPTQTVEVRVTPRSPTPTAQVTAAIPDLVEYELESARSLARDAGFVLVVVGERHDPRIHESHIISQSVAAGKQAPLGTDLAVVVSLGPEWVTMPEAVGFPAVVEQLELEDLGLTPVLTETWSLEPIGLVVAQSPSPGTEVSVGSVVTLTVSGGPLNEIRANLGGKVLLFSCELSNVLFGPGDTMQVIITWHVLNPPNESYKVFIHVTDSAGHILTQRDAAPLGGSRPTNTWRAGEKLLDPYTISLPPHASSGHYRVQVGMYRGDSRLPVIDSGLAQVEDDAVVVRQIEIRPN